MSICTKKGSRTAIMLGAKFIFYPDTKCLEILNYENGLWQNIYFIKNKKKQIDFIKSFSHFKQFVEFLAFTLGRGINKPYVRHGRWACTLCLKYDYKYFVIRDKNGLVWDEERKLIQIIPEKDDALNCVEIELGNRGVIPAYFVQNKNDFFALLQIICETHWIKISKKVESPGYFEVKFESA
ncbi:MAG: hypothetical protein L3J07_04545 [Candidatus Magasanikbacteria bacterium]|nr:hypothetical protein [Candidatus Magasanikbacteria bacterium]